MSKTSSPPQDDFNLVSLKYLVKEVVETLGLFIEDIVIRFIYELNSMIDPTSLKFNFMSKIETSCAKFVGMKVIPINNRLPWDIFRI